MKISESLYKIAGNPVHGIIATLATLGTLCSLGLEPLEALVSSLSVLCIFGALYVERECLESVLLCPLTVFTMAATIRWGIGATIMNFLTPIEGSTIIEISMIENSLKLQIQWLVLNSITILVFLITRSQRGVCLIGLNKEFRNERVTSKIVPLLCILGAFGFLWLLTGWISGTLDRTPEVYYKWVTRLWRPDSLFVAFARLRDVFFYLLPLGLYKAKNVQRIFLCLITIAYFSVAVALGGRGIVLNPVLWLLFGSYMIPRLKLLPFLVSLVFVALMSTVGTTALKSGVAQNIDRLDYAQRIQLLGKRFVQLGFEGHSPYEWQAFATRLYGCADGLNFTAENRASEPAGFVRVERLEAVGKPSLLFPSSKPLRDSHMIVEELLGATRSEAERKQYTSFECISFVGDLYWRGRWHGVVLGSIFFAVLYRVFAHYWYRFSSTANISGLLITAFPSTFLVLFPVGSIGETVWLWTWDFPKYMVMLLFLATCSRILHRLKRGC